jgi:hypothetical protein
MQTQNIPISITTPSPNPATPKKSGCGCCGCLSGCLVALLIPIGILFALYFTMDFGKMTDHTLVWAYKEVFRPKIIEASLSASLSPQEKNAALQLSDQFVEDYLKLPEEEKKLIRREAFTYLYYDMQNQAPPPEEIIHLNRFIETQKQKFQDNPAFPLLDSKAKNKTP